MEEQMHRNRTFVPQPRLAGAVRPFSRSWGTDCEDVSGDGGVLKEIVRAGSGDLVPSDASVLVKYSAYLEYAEQPFDTNRYRRNRRLMKLGTDITLGGMEIALLTMQKGEFSRYLFKPAYACGALGCPPLIPQNATILFELELLDFLDTALSDDFFALSPNQQSTFPLEKVLKVANIEREFGNHLFQQNRFYDAKDRYKQASSILGCCSVEEHEQNLIGSTWLLVFLNLSLTYMKLERPARALVYGEKALEIDQSHPKALFRCGQACLALTEYEQAQDFLIRAQRRQTFNKDINNELKKLDSCYRDYMEKQKELCSRMFTPLNPALVED
ncbi:inactive peptidyl-prolyl cis-trans isomerase FKBP6-like [Ambystoma mexicanum]|uniref:inactive peptidyl-prolyl cis-trans isomerase FKBP6-like n=1 Tax=Ambystoma mexicanum TaxID=8296 RepID=UPI0037E76499